MAYTTIDDPSAHFQSFLYTGNGSSRTITLPGNSNLKFDMYWYKARNETGQHRIFDTNRGLSLELYPNLTAADSAATYVSNQTANGFDLNSGDSSTNKNGATYANWQWKANGGTTATNNDGSITTTTQVNSDAGFSIVTWAGGGTGSLGHGLGVVPDMWIVKNRDYAVSWAIGFSDSSFLGGTSNYLSLNTDGATATYNNLWGSSPVNSSAITMAGDRSVNISGNDYVAYFFKAKQGYSKFGKYVGNASADGPFVYTGFKPAWVMIKGADVADDWYIFDNKRAGYNPEVFRLRANTTGTETTGTNNTVDHLSNGFKLRFNGGSMNASKLPYIYMAFAENPFVTSTGVPTTAR